MNLKAFTRMHQNMLFCDKKIKLFWNDLVPNATFVYDIVRIKHTVSGRYKRIITYSTFASSSYLSCY